MATIDGDITIAVPGYPAYTFTPAAMSVDLDSLASEDSGRTDDGVMHIEWIKTRYRKVNITMPPMSQTQARAILNLIQGRIYTITYRDPIDGVKTISVYTSKSNATLYSGTIHNGIWTGCSFNAIGMGGDTQ